MTDYKTVSAPSEHPLEEVFDIEKGTTMTEYVEPIPTEVQSAPTYDEKDMEVEGQLQEVYDAAMAQHEMQTHHLRSIEGRYYARGSEVAIQALSVALQAARTKAEIKGNKDKLQLKRESTGPSTVNQNLIVADRNELLRTLAGKK